MRKRMVMITVMMMMIMKASNFHNTIQTIHLESICGGGSLKLCSKFHSMREYWKSTSKIKGNKTSGMVFSSATHTREYQACEKLKGNPFHL